MAEFSDILLRISPTKIKEFSARMKDVETADDMAKAVADFGVSASQEEIEALFDYVTGPLENSDVMTLNAGTDYVAGKRKLTILDL